MSILRVDDLNERNLYILFLVRDAQIVRAEMEPVCDLVSESISACYLNVNFVVITKQ